MLSRQARLERYRRGTSETNPKSEYRNPKQTQSQINLNRENPKHRIRKEACLEFYLFWSFEIVSNFGFRASNFLFLAPLRLCARHSFSDVLFNSDFPRAFSFRQRNP